MRNTLRSYRFLITTWLIMIIIQNINNNKVGISVVSFVFPMYVILLFCEYNISFNIFYFVYRSGYMIYDIIYLQY